MAESGLSSAEHKFMSVPVILIFVLVPVLTAFAIQANLNRPLKAKPALCVLPSWNSMSGKLSDSQVRDAREVMLNCINDQEYFMSLPKPDQEEIIIWVGDLISTEFFRHDRLGPSPDSLVSLILDINREDLVYEIAVRNVKSVDLIEYLRAIDFDSRLRESFPWFQLLDVMKKDQGLVAEDAYMFVEERVE